MSEYYKPLREIAPFCELPENLDQAVWHYMDLWKFISLIQKHELFLCRGDTLLDRFEGTYSRRQIQSTSNWLREVDETGKIEQDEQERRRKNRKKIFISCWCMSDVDLDMMWKAYAPSIGGVALKSTIRKLQSVCDSAIELWPLDISMVKYFDHEKGQNINYCGVPNVFMHKDHHFRLDNEIRIIHLQKCFPPPEHVFLPIRIEEAIEAIVTKPDTNESQFKSIEGLLQSNGLRIPVIRSRDDRPLVE